MNELRNRVTDLTAQIITLQQDNKQLRRDYRQQERRLELFESQENDMPLIIQRHGEETNMLREQLRRHRDKYEKTCKKLHDVGEELDRTQRLLKKMKGLVDDRHLAERDELNQKLTKAEVELKEKEEAIRVCAEL